MCRGLSTNFSRYTASSPNAALSLRAGQLQRIADFRIGVNQPHALATATRRRLEHDGITHAISRRGVLHSHLAQGSIVPGTIGTPYRAAALLDSSLEPISAIDFGEGPMKISPASRTSLCELGIL